MSGSRLFYLIALLWTAVQAALISINYAYKSLLGEYDFTNIAMSTLTVADTGTAATAIDITFGNYLSFSHFPYNRQR